jgi:putative tryptophan/tyrosine transport system substrate-binding protein
MKRREFVGLLSGAAAWPLAARAQQVGVVKRLAILYDASEALGGGDIAVFRQGLERAGWSEGRTLRTTVRWGDARADRIRAAAAELVRMNPDLIFTVGGTGLMALVSETRSIPILFASVGDPVATGSVASLAHPGGNATGFTAYQGSFATRWLQLLKEMAPAVTHLLVLSPGNPNSTATLPEIERAVGSFALQMTTARVAGPDEIERAIGAAARVPNLGMTVLPGGLTIVHRDLIIAVAARYRVPAIYGSRIFAEAGGLVSYAPDLLELIRQAVSYGDRILRGEKPSELPVQAASKFELIINAKTAKALGLAVPTTLLATADEVIE